MQVFLEHASDYNLLRIFPTSFIIDIRQGSKYTSVLGLYS